MDISLEELLAQEETLQFTQFDEEIALQLGLWVVEYARENELPVVVDIRRGEHQLFHASRPGTSIENDGWVERKARLVNHLSHSSFYLHQLLKSEGVTMEEKWQLSKSEYAPFGGCFPIIIKNEGLVGTIAISGLPQDEDHALAVKALKTYLETTA
jgi:uncharacterized protein (UPF0303 family)